MSLDPVEAMDTSSPHPEAGGPSDLSPSSESREKLDAEYRQWKGANEGSIIALTKVWPLFTHLSSLFTAFFLDLEITHRFFF